LIKAKRPDQAAVADRTAGACIVAGPGIKVTAQLLAVAAIWIGVVLGTIRVRCGEVKST
jgi:hypothetical protein